MLHNSCRQHHSTLLVQALPECQGSALSMRWQQNHQCRHAMHTSCIDAILLQHNRYINRHLNTREGC